jgi:peptide/nickel transport system permease protein
LRAALAALLVCLLGWTLVECGSKSLPQRAAEASGALDAAEMELSADERRAVLAMSAHSFELEGGAARRMRARVGELVSWKQGRSWRDAQAIGPRLWSRGAYSLALSLVALAVAALLGIGAAVAVREERRPWLERLAEASSALFMTLSLPVIALLALGAFALGRPFELVPVSGGGLGAAIMPALVLALPVAASIYRHTLGGLRRCEGEAWTRALLAKGMARRRLVRRHFLRHALRAPLALAPAFVAYLLGASVVVERVFGLPGLGDWLARSAAAGDLPVVMSAACFGAFVIALCSSAVESLLDRVDPRRSVGRGEEATR